jgi:coenzyme F420-0:L-glutamate ligase/coenzyme F420-1:gamma-L-glutamate ligase
MNATPASSLVLTALLSIPVVQPGDDLTKIAITGLGDSGIALAHGDVLVFAQKIISKAEDRFVNLDKVTPSSKAKKLADETGKDARLVEVVLQESVRVVRTRENLIIVEHRLGFVCANAGVDHSNVASPDGQPGEWVLLLPENPDASAMRLRKEIQDSTGANIGILIIDSHGRAWRLGTVGITIGIAGFPALLDMRGKPDLYGNTLVVTQVGLADEVAAGASALMGQADEGRPIVHVRGLPYELREGSLGELIRPKDEDLFR